MKLGKLFGNSEYDLGGLFSEEALDKLEQTHCQCAIYVASLAAVERLRHSRPDVLDRLQAVAGIGVGEFAALHTAGVFAGEEGLDLSLDLVHLRAMAMQEASGEYLQLSLTGVELDRVRAMCEEARSGTESVPAAGSSPKTKRGREKKGGATACGDLEVCSVSHALLPKGHICAGTQAAMKRLHQLGESQKRVNVRANVVGLSGSYTALMERPMRQLRARLKEAVPLMRPPRCAVYFNAIGEALPAGADPSLVAELLSAQLTNTVLWEPTVRTMIREGVDDLVVCDPREAKDSALHGILMKLLADGGSARARTMMSQDYMQAPVEPNGTEKRTTKLR